MSRTVTRTKAVKERKVSSNGTSAKAKPAERRCFVCKKTKPLRDFEVPPGKPRAKICTACLDTGKLRHFTRICNEKAPGCEDTFTSTSPRACVCENCKPIRIARLAAERAKAYRAKKKANVAKGGQK